MGGIANHGEDTPEVKAGRLRAISPDEVYSGWELKAIIKAAAPRYARAPLMTAIRGGARHGELAALRWSQLDLKKGILTINGH